MCVPLGLAYPMYKKCRDKYGAGSIGVGEEDGEGREGGVEDGGRERGGKKGKKRGTREGPEKRKQGI